MAFDAFLKIDGIKGESQKQNHTGEIEIYSFSLGASNPTTVGMGTGLSAGKVTLSDFSIMKSTDKASPTLFSNCCAGKSFKTATVALQKATGSTTGETYLQYDFTNIFVSSIQWSGSSGGDDAPTESVSFVYESFKITYKPQNPDGSLGTQVIAGWDQAKNTKV
jgi:type VI secretion system secreted protein Hcp